MFKHIVAGLLFTAAGAALAVPPTVSVTSPAANSTYVAPATIPLAASASDVDDTVNRVRFFRGTTLIGSDFTAPFTYNWSYVAAGNYSITAEARDNSGAITKSAPITINVHAAPTVSMASPASGTVFAAPATITLTANASDADGIAKVEFYQGTTLIGSDTASPYSVSWSNVAAGSYSVTAKATDIKGATKTSTAITLIVNRPPTVTLTAPANNVNYTTVPATVTLSASASDTDGSISRVQFYRGTILIGSDTTAPYSFSWTNVAAGSYTITARATDNRGAVTTSAPVTITVGTPPNTPPTVAITSPANNASFVTPAAMTLSANASDSNGSVSKVEYFNGATLIGTATAAPYTVAWNNVAAGTYTITAKATDNQNAVTTSAPVSVTVAANALPTVAITAPANNALYSSPANLTFTATALDADGTISKVEYFHGATLIGSATTAPYAVNWSNVGSGNYVITAKATDDKGGVTTSAAINVAVDNVPTISIASPANNATFAAPATITLTANAADSDGTVQKVDYFAGATLIGSATAAPYTVTWSNVASGAYVITAKATDAKGQTSTSSALNVSVNGLPTVAITSPANNATFLAPTSLTVSVNATDSDGQVTKVEFFNNGVLIAQHIGTTSPYTMTLDKPAAGTYVITAKAHDNQGGTTVSSPVTFTVNPNALPTVSLTGPSEGQTYLAPATITLNATADDTDGTVHRVELYQGATLLATLTQPPYAYEWKGVAAGNYTLFAKAIDNLDGTSTSSAINVTVQPSQGPTITLEANPPSTATPGNVMLSANVADADGAVAKVEFFNGTNLLAIRTEAPFAYNWLNIPAGTYTLTAKVTDNGGMETVSNAVTVTVAQGPAQAYYIHADHLNTPRLITDQTGNNVWEWENTDPFGGNAANEDPSNAGSRLTFNLRFPGQYFDKETGLHYNYYRDYDPNTGRYVQSDPIGLKGGINTYGYVGGDPIFYSDPFGLEVYVCSQPAFGWMPVDHKWLRTDTVEAGMGGTRGNEAGNESGDRPGDPVQVTDHTGRSKQEGSSCEVVKGVDEKTVNDLLKIGRPLGRWWPTNQCQSFVKQVLDEARRSRSGSINYGAK